MGNYGDRIKKARESAGLTQEQLGELIGVTGVTIMRYEKNQREPRQKQLESIAAALGVDPYSLADWDTASKMLEYHMNTDPLKAQLDAAYDRLNEKGQQVAVERVEELTKIHDYQKTKEPPRSEGEQDG